jgi:hypothetical protein
VVHAKKAEIDRLAQSIIRRYGAEAEVIAAGQADTMLDAGDIRAFDTWKAVMAAIRRLQTPQDG